jgi:hypothetical protein
MLTFLFSLLAVVVAQQANLPRRGFYCNGVNRDDPFQVCRYNGRNESVFLTLKVREEKMEKKSLFLSHSFPSHLTHLNFLFLFLDRPPKVPFASQA